MFTCLHLPGVVDDAAQQALLDCAYSFSPEVENTAPGTVVLDTGGTERLFGAPKKMCNRICAAGATSGLILRVSVSRDPDAAIHAARGFQENTIVPPGKEAEFLAPLPVKALCPSLAGVQEDRAQEILETLQIWGVRTFGEFSALPEPGVFERLGAEGILLQKLARGRTARLLVRHLPPPGYLISAELEYPVEVLEPLLFTVARMINQLCANLKIHALAAAQLMIRLRLADGSEMEYPIGLAVPTQDHRLLLKVTEVELQAHPPSSGVIAARVSCEPARARVIQNGLFASFAPEPAKLEMQFARIARIVGKANVGSAELLDTHRPQAFSVRRFRPHSHTATPIGFIPRSCSVAMRILRPSPRAAVTTRDGRPTHLCVDPAGACPGVSGSVIAAAGPWHASGDWWSERVWTRNEWDVELSNGSVWRIFFDRLADSWFAEGFYD